MQTKLTKPLAAVLLTLGAAGCQTATGGTESAVCAQWKGITWSSQDTPQTRDEVRGNNARRGAWCR